MNETKPRYFRNINFIDDLISFQDVEPESLWRLEPQGMVLVDDDDYFVLKNYDLQDFRELPPGEVPEIRD